MRGFTLIELLVVLAITAIFGMVAFINLRGFGTEQNLKNNALDLVNILKSVQTNASASVKCRDVDPSSWQVRISQNGQKIVMETICGTTLSSKTISESVLLDKVTGKETCSLTDLSGDNALTLSFTLLTGNVSFSSLNECFSRSSEVTINIKDLKDPNLKQSVVINKGGAIYVK